LPPGVDPKRLAAMPLVSIQDRATQPGNEKIGDKTFPAVIPLVVGDRVEIRIAISKPPVPVGHYLSVVYERKAGDPQDPHGDPSHPPPRPVIATVLVSFIQSPI
jgi:hypothetical protein